MKKIILAIALIVLSGFALYTYFMLDQGYEIEILESGASDQAEKEFKAKIAHYEEWLKNSRSELDELNAKTDELTIKDQELERKMHELERKLNIPEGDFEAKYPGFSTDGEQ